MFRCALNTPEVYSQGSRDFQLFCNIFDAAHGWSKACIDSITSITSTEECAVSIVPLIRSKVGLFSDIDVDDDDMRCILGAFPLLIRNKGTLISMQWTINMLHRYFNKGESPPEISINETSNTVEVTTNVHLPYERILVQLLQIVAPAGLTVSVLTSQSGDSGDVLALNDDLKVTTKRKQEGAVVYQHPETPADNSDTRSAIIFDEEVS